MSDFQTQIHTYPARGVAGDKASLNPAVYTTLGYLSGDDKVAVGNFVFPLSQGVGDVPLAGSNPGASGTATQTFSGSLARRRAA